MRNVRSTRKGVLRTNSQDTMSTSSSARHEAERRRQHDGRGGLEQARPDDGAEARLGDAGADQAADQRMRADSRGCRHTR